MTPGTSAQASLYAVTTLPTYIVLRGDQYQFATKSANDLTQFLRYYAAEK